MSEVRFYVVFGALIAGIILMAELPNVLGESPVSTLSSRGWDVEDDFKLHTLHTLPELSKHDVENNDVVEVVDAPNGMTVYLAVESQRDGGDEVVVVEFLLEDVTFRLMDDSTSSVTFSGISSRGRHENTLERTSTAELLQEADHVTVHLPENEFQEEVAEHLPQP